MSNYQYKAELTSLYANRNTIHIGNKDKADGMTMETYRQSINETNSVAIKY